MNFENSCQILRCPHDQENPYLMINRELIRNSSISPEARWLLIYLLSHDKSFSPTPKYIVKTQKIGRDRLYKLFNELIEGGYILKEEIKEPNNLIRVRYVYSETPKFKKTFRRPDFQDPEIQDPENTYIKKEQVKKEQDKEKEIYKERKTPPNPQKGSSKIYISPEAEELVQDIKERFRLENPNALEMTPIQLKRDKNAAHDLLVSLTDKTDSASSSLNESLEIAKKVVDWSFRDEFWKGRVKSAYYLKLKWNNILISMNSKNQSSIKSPTNSGRFVCKADSEYVCLSDDELRKQGRLIE